MEEDVDPGEEIRKFDFETIKLYLPPSIQQELPYIKDMLFRYLDSEFPNQTQTAIYHIPKTFCKKGEVQACQAEEIVFQRLRGLASLNEPNLWITFFHGASYGGFSNRNQRLGKLMIREHDFIVFVKFQEQQFVVLMEVKSTNDRATIKTNLEMTADSKIIKNNKRSAQHQIRDHLEMLQNSLGYNVSNEIQSYIMWPFLGQYTKDPKQQTILRWVEDKNLHVFENVLAEQVTFNQWFLQVVMSQGSCTTKTFAHLLTRYIVLSFGVFMDEIDNDLIALLTQEQLNVLDNTHCQNGGALVVHGIAGTGKTMLVIKKLQLLHEKGLLNSDNRALYICYWPGIRCDVELKLRALGIFDYVDTARLYVSSDEFLRKNTKKYKHVFMDEAEATILSFHKEIVQNTFYKLYKAYHDGNCNKEKCNLATLDTFQQNSITTLIQQHGEEKIHWGELWFLVDTNQTLIFLPKHSPQILKTPNVILNKLIRSTTSISSFFSAVTEQPIPPEHLRFPKLEKEPPIIWVPRKSNVAQSVSEVVVDLCTTRGVKPCDICVIPFLQNEKLTTQVINSQICQKFVKNGFKPVAVGDVEDFLINRRPNEFLLAWALRVKGLEFKVVVMAIDQEQFDNEDSDDRRKVYVISSRSTCMLIVICDEEQKEVLQISGLTDFSKHCCLNVEFVSESNEDE